MPQQQYVKVWVWVDTRKKIDRALRLHRLAWPKEQVSLSGLLDTALENLCTAIERRIQSQGKRVRDLVPPEAGPGPAPFAGLPRKPSRPKCDD